MRQTTAMRSIKWFVSALALTVSCAGVNPAFAQAEAPTKAKITKSEKPKSKTLLGTFSKADAKAVNVKGKSEELNYSLVPSTVYWRTQKSVSASDLKVGETVKMNLPGTDDIGRIESVSPLTLKFGDNATLTYTNTRRMKFERVSKITATDLVAGQKGKIAGNVYPDGRIEAREVWVEVEPEKKVLPKKQ